MLKKRNSRKNSYYDYNSKKTRKFMKKDRYGNQKTMPVINNNKRKSLVLRARIPLPFVIPEETSKILQRIESIFMSCHGRRTKVKQKYSEN